jgi:RimJ/RimL family protein N-acetyltransferase
MTAYLTWDPHETPKESAEFLDEAADARENGEGSTYVVRPREGEDGAGELAGMTAIAPDWETRTAELGIWLRKPFWGRGYSGERAGALLSVAFDRLDLDAVVVAVHRDNEKSRAAVSGYVEAHGGRCEGLLRNYHVDGDGKPFDAYRYTVTAEEYRVSAAN